MKHNALFDKGIEYIIPIIKRVRDGKVLSDKDITIKLSKEDDKVVTEVGFPKTSETVTISADDLLEASDIAENTITTSAFLKTRVKIMDKDGVERIFTFRREFTKFCKKTMLVVEWYSEKNINKIFIDPEILFWGDYPIVRSIV